MSADADRPGWRTLERRRLEDLAFLTWVRTASRGELKAYARHTMPTWRRVAVVRAMQRVGRTG